MFLSPFPVASLWSLAYFVGFFLILWLVYKGSRPIYFNPQDYAKALREKELPEYPRGHAPRLE